MSYLVFGRGGLVLGGGIHGLGSGVSSRGGSGVGGGDVHLSVDGIVALDVAALAGEDHLPVGLGVVTDAGLGLGVVQTGVLVLHGPVEFVVGSVGLFLVSPYTYI